MKYFLILAAGVAVILALDLIVVAIANADASTVQASCYGSEAGSVTASGESFDPNEHTAASRTLPLGTRLLVRHGSRSVAVSVNDVGPAAWTGRDLDLSMSACQAVGLVEDGAGAVEVEQIPSTSSGNLPETGGPK